MKEQIIPKGHETMSNKNGMRTVGLATALLLVLGYSTSVSAHPKDKSQDIANVVKSPEKSDFTKTVSITDFDEVDGDAEENSSVRDSIEKYHQRQKELEKKYEDYLKTLTDPEIEDYISGVLKTSNKVQKSLDDVSSNKNTANAVRNGNSKFLENEFFMRKSLFIAGMLGGFLGVMLAPMMSGEARKKMIRGIKNIKDNLLRSIKRFSGNNQAKEDISKEEDIPMEEDEAIEELITIINKNMRGDVKYDEKLLLPIYIIIKDIYEVQEKFLKLSEESRDLNPLFFISNLKYELKILYLLHKVMPDLRGKLEKEIEKNFGLSTENNEDFDGWLYRWFR